MSIVGILCRVQRRLWCLLVRALYIEPTQLHWKLTNVDHLTNTTDGLTDSHWHRHNIHNQCKTRETNWCSFARYSKIIIEWSKYVEISRNDVRPKEQSTSTSHLRWQLSSSDSSWAPGPESRRCHRSMGDVRLQWFDDMALSTCFNLTIRLDPRYDMIRCMS